MCQEHTDAMAVVLFANTKQQRTVEVGKKKLLEYSVGQILQILQTSIQSIQSTHPKHFAK